jgi:hypothetical protein
MDTRLFYCWFYCLRVIALHCMSWWLLFRGARTTTANRKIQLKCEEHEKS